MARLLGGQSTTARLEELTAAKEEQARLESVVYHLGSSDTSPEAVSLRTRAEAAKAKVLKLDKNAPQTPLECNAVEVALATHEGNQLARSQRVENAKAAAKQRDGERAKWLDSLAEQLVAVRERSLQLEVARDQAYEARALEQQEHDAAVQELLLKKKEELEQKLDCTATTIDLTQQDAAPSLSTPATSSAVSPQTSAVFQEMEKKLME